MVQVVVECTPGELPKVIEAPQRVAVRLGRLAQGQINDLRTLLRELAATGPRELEVDLAGVDVTHRPVVFAVLVGAVREARRHATTIRIRRAPPELRRTFAVVGIDEATAPDEPTYTIVLGTAAAPQPRARIASPATA